MPKSMASKGKPAEKNVVCKGGGRGRQKLPLKELRHGKKLASFSSLSFVIRLNLPQS